jgi:hypothetical protein
MRPSRSGAGAACSSRPPAHPAISHTWADKSGGRRRGRRRYPTGLVPPIGAGPYLTPGCCSWPTWGIWGRVSSARQDADTRRISLASPTGWLPRGARNRWRQCSEGRNIVRMATRSVVSESTPAEQHARPLPKAYPSALQDHVARLVAKAPPLTAEQRQRLRPLLNVHGQEHTDTPLSAAAA